MSYLEREVRDNFGNYVSEIVSTNGGELGGKKDISFEAMVQRATQAIVGAKAYKSKFSGKSFDTMP